MNKWKERERELNAKAKEAKRGKLIHSSLVEIMHKGKIVLVGNTYRKPK